MRLQTQFCHSHVPVRTRFLRWEIETLVAFAFGLSQVSKPFCHARAGFGRCFEDADAGTNLIDVLESRRAIEANGFGDVDLGDDRRHRRS